MIFFSPLSIIIRSLLEENYSWFPRKPVSLNWFNVRDAQLVWCPNLFGEMIKYVCQPNIRRRLAGRRILIYIQNMRQKHNPTEEIWSADTVSWWWTPDTGAGGAGDTVCSVHCRWSHGASGPGTPPASSRAEKLLQTSYQMPSYNNLRPAHISWCSFAQRCRCTSHFVL